MSELADSKLLQSDSGQSVAYTPGCLIVSDDDVDDADTEVTIPEGAAAVVVHSAVAARVTVGPAGVTFDDNEWPVPAGGASIQFPVSEFAGGKVLVKAAEGNLGFVSVMFWGKGLQG
jgi:hypothetical protein